MVNDQVLSHSDPASTISHTLDNLGRATTIASSISGLTPTVTFIQVFDAASNRTELGATVGSTLDYKNTYQYGALNRLVETVQQAQSGGNAVTRGGIKLGRLDQIIGYAKPNRRPEWKTPEEYGATPDYIFVRHLRYQVHQKGFRTRTIVIATTLLNSVAYTAESIAQLYRQRWQAEIDIRSLKTHMQMEHLRCKSPAMVRKEIYCHMLAYNLVRLAIAESATISDMKPNQLSFTGAKQALGSFLLAVAAKGCNLDAQYQGLLITISESPIGDRPDRIEPRQVKRRPKPYELLTEPRAQARKRAS